MVEGFAGAAVTLQHLNTQLALGQPIDLSQSAGGERHSKQQWRSKHSSATDELQTEGAATIVGVKRRRTLTPFWRVYPHYSLQKFAVASDRRRRCIALELASEATISWRSHELA